jgi:protein-disulfide isomerase
LSTISSLQLGGQAGGSVVKQDENVIVKVNERLDAPSLGSAKAKVVMYEFSDIQCPFCQKFYSETFAKIKTNYIDTGKVRFVYRHLPLVGIHPNAQKAAEAIECANKQGKFESYHDLIFSKARTDGGGLSLEDLKSYANTLGLNSGTLGFGKNKFNNCLENSETASAVKKDLSDAGIAGATGTPSFFINGKKISGAAPYENFKTIIDEALTK